MLGEIVLWSSLLLPLALGAGFRVSASNLFFSLMAGELLARYFGHDIDALLKPLVGAAEGGSYGEILLVVLPMLVTVFFLRGSISRHRVLINIFPLLVMGVICAAFLLPVMPAFIQETVRSVALGDTILHLHRAIVGTMVGIQLAALLVMNRKGGHRNA